jgi:phage repressor protein C with HTH and peptisase S24 domain
MLDEDDVPVSEDDLAKILKGRSNRKLFKPPTYRPLGRNGNLSIDVDQQALAEQFDLVAVQEIDLKFGMGATELELPVTSQIRHFSREWLRQYTHANPDKLYFAQGIGDSMEPTIKDSDLLLIDTSEDTIRVSDKFWAIAFGYSGMVKRLRPMPDGSVRILSDNPNVPDEVAHDGELHLLGRVVGIVRKM